MNEAQPTSLDNIITESDVVSKLKELTYLESLWTIEGEIREKHKHKLFHNWEHTEAVRHSALTLFDKLFSQELAEERDESLSDEQILAIRSAIALSSTLHDVVFEQTFDEQSGRMIRHRGWVLDGEPLGEGEGRNEWRSYRLALREILLKGGLLSDLEIDENNNKQLAELVESELESDTISPTLKLFLASLKTGIGATYPDFKLAASFPDQSDAASIALKVKSTEGDEVTDLRPYLSANEEGLLSGILVSQPLLENDMATQVGSEHWAAICVGLSDLGQYGYTKLSKYAIKAGYGELLESQPGFTKKLYTLNADSASDVLETIYDWTQNQIGFAIHQQQRINSIITKHPLLRGNGELQDICSEHFGNFEKNIAALVELLPQIESLQREPTEDIGSLKERILSIMGFSEPEFKVIWQKFSLVNTQNPLMRKIRLSEISSFRSV